MATWLQDRITSIQARIEALEAASLGISSGAITSYELDTGQSKQRVTKENLTQLQAVLDGLYNQYTILSNRVTGAGVHRSVDGC